MRALTVILAGGAGLAAMAGAAPAAAQFYPGYGYGSPYGRSYGGGVSSQVAINQCAAAAQQRLGGGYGGYGYNGYGGGRVLGISRVEPRANGFVVRGVASSGRYGGYGYAAQSPVDLTWRCSIDFRGFVTDVSVGAAQPNYGYGNYTPWNFDVSQYGYVRY